MKFVQLVLLLPLLWMTSCTREAAPPNVLLVVVDALRADHLGCYGHDRDTSPFLDEFSRQGVRFARAYAQGSQTKVSMAALMTGFTPPTNKVRTASFSENRRIVKSDRLSRKATTLAETLRRSGYRTAGFVTNPHLQRFQGFAQGFETYKYTFWHKLQAPDVNRQALAWLDAQPPEAEEKPFFMYLHFMDVHFPYNPPAPWRTLYAPDDTGLEPIQVNGPPGETFSPEKIAFTKALYDAQINYWDDHFRRLIGELETRGLLKNTVVVVVADHGDEFNEHGGFGHGFTVYEEMIHVPLIMVCPDRLEPAVRNEVVRLVDVLPTICGLTGAPSRVVNLEGLDLFDPALADQRTDLKAYAETFLGDKPRGLRSASDQLIFNAAVRSWEYYDLMADANQTHNLYRVKDPHQAALRKDLRAAMEGRFLFQRQEDEAADPETEKALRSLGYVR